MNKCTTCDIEISSKALTCSPRCRKIASRMTSVTQGNVSVTQPIAEGLFKFTVAIGPRDEERELVEQKNKVRQAKYWYDVPIAAVPIIQKDWPKMPEFLNGRQYFLWWKNEFKVNEAGEPIILNPFPERDKVEYYRAGEGSRRWGA